MSNQVIRLDEAPLFDLLTIATLFLVALLGAIIAFQAYRGYRRNDSQSMLYLAGGLLLLTLVPFVLNVTISSLTTADQVITIFAENVSRLVGVVVIMYSLYGRH